MGTPTIDLVSIGAGGGSIAALGTGDRLRVGPESAGADPGPVCYGNGGTSPTVTDANLVLGRIPGFLLGGEMSLDAEGARDVLGTMGSKLGLGVEEFAYGILQLAAANMAGAVRQVSVKRGRDPREYSLFAYGGAGPLHAADVADLLGIKRIVVPPRPGLGSCLGLLSADIQSAAVQTVSSKIEDLDHGKISQTIDDLSARVMEDIVAQGIGRETVELTTLMDLCYVGQATELTIPLSGNPAEAESLRGILEHFHAEHARVYGYHYVNEQPVKVVNIRVRGNGPLRPIVLPIIESGDQSIEDAKTGSREVYFGPNEGAQDTNIYDRNILISGTTFEGPAIVTEYDSTILIPPGAKAEVDQYGNLLINL
jgi:N-methylhydantoinase A